MIDVLSQEIYDAESNNLSTLDTWRHLNSDVSLVRLSNSLLCASTLQRHADRVFDAIGTLDAHTIRLIDE